MTHMNNVFVVRSVDGRPRGDTNNGGERVGT